jgi:plasmid replication initiation protein
VSVVYTVLMNTKKKQDVVKSNALIGARYAPGSVYKMRLMMAALLQIKAKDKLDHTTEFIVTADELSELTNTVGKVNNYRELKKAATELMKTIVEVSDLPNGDKGEVEDRWVNLTSSCRYVKKESHVVLTFGPYAVPYISSLSKQFTAYLAKNVMSMKSGYGIRLYEMAVSWLGIESPKSTVEHVFEIEDFRATFGLMEKYPEIRSLKSRVIDPAMKDINECSDIEITIDQRKSGRRITHFIFTVTDPSKVKKAKAMPIEKWVGEYNIGHGQAKISAATRKKYEVYKADPDAWVQAELKL